MKIRRCKRYGSPTKIKTVLNKTRIRTSIFCGYCGIEMHKKQVTFDHIIPRAKGGTSEIHNLMPCCKTCNISKAAMSLEEFREHVNKTSFYFEEPESR